MGLRPDDLHLEIRRLVAVDKAGTTEMKARQSNFDIGYDDINLRAFGYVNAGVQLDLSSFHDPLKRLHTHAEIVAN